MVAGVLVRGTRGACRRAAAAAAGVCAARCTAQPRTARAGPRAAPAPAGRGRGWAAAAGAAAGEPAVQEEAPASADPATLSKLEIRVGKILSVEKHPDADSLYVEQVDVGEAEPRTIISGLVDFVPQDEMDGRDVVVLCNLKARNMRGIKSLGMLLCASEKGDGKVEPLAPPAGAPVGERLCFGEFQEEYPEPATGNQMNKKKFWEKIQPDLATAADGAAVWKDTPLTGSTGPVRAGLAGGSIS